MSGQSHEELVGTRIGDYIIEDYIGAGGQAVVYRARSQASGAEYALKVFGLLESVQAPIEAGLNEARRQSRIKHPAVVKFSEPGTDEIALNGTTRRVLYIPMDFSPLGSCEGEPLFSGRILTDRDYRTMINLLDGLNAIHTAKIIHNDIKPANILRFHERMNGEDRSLLRITDFGVAKVESAMGIGTGELSGFTPEFMAPERLKGPNVKCDVYSMGVTLFFMLTGKLPIKAAGETLVDWEKAHREQPRPHANEVDDDCPPRLALLIVRMMGVQPSERPDLTECIAELQALIELYTGLIFEFKAPAELEEAISTRQFPIRYSPGFRGYL